MAADEDIWAAGGIGLTVQLTEESGSEDLSKSVKTTPGHMAGQYSLCSMVESVSQDPTLIILTENTDTPITVVMVEEVAGLRMCTL